MNQSPETSEKLSAKEKTDMDGKKFHRGYNWRMVSGSPTGNPSVARPSVARSGSKSRPRARIPDLSDISLEPEDFVTTHRLIDDKLEAAPPPPPASSESDEQPVQTKNSGVAKFLLLLLALLTVAIIIPRLLPSDYSGLSFFSFRGDPSKFSAPAGSGDWQEERPLAPRIVGEKIDPGRLSLKGPHEEARPAAQNCLPADPRSGFVPDNPVTEPGISAMPQASSVMSPTLVSRRLQEIELRLRECELILQLLDSGKGAFSGFVPENNITGISSLARFQEKIVQLEINKQALAVRFAPTSKEIQAIDLEIQGVKTAMRECVEANLRFFQKGREQLLRQKTNSERKKGPIGTNGKGPRPECSEPSLLGRCWSFLSDGIDNVMQQLLSASKSIASRASKLANKLIFHDGSYVHRNPSPAKAENDWAQLAGSGNIKRPESRINNSVRAEKPSKCASNRHGQRVVNVAPKPEAEAGLSDPTGARRRLWQSLRDSENSCESH